MNHKEKALLIGTPFLQRGGGTKKNRFAIGLFLLVILLAPSFALTTDNSSEMINTIETGTSYYEVVLDDKTDIVSYAYMFGGIIAGAFVLWRKFFKEEENVT